jgi:hypothetical protein
MTKDRLTGVLLAALVVVCCNSSAQTQANKPNSFGADENPVKNAAPTLKWLVTPSDALSYQGEEGYAQLPMLSAKSVTPLIEVLKPELNAELKVKAPFTITVHFKGQPDAAIVPSTFKILYGALKFDITNRITKFVTITNEGFSIENAQIPVGKHKLILQVEDEKHRLAERELKFEVE